MSNKKSEKKSSVPQRAASSPGAPVTAKDMIAGVSGIGGFVFGDVRPSSDMILNTDVSGETSQDQVKQPLPTPRPSGDLAIDLASVISADAINAIIKNQ